ncbi:MAG: hypothetical protein OEY49_01250, partial [Candidatus Heimdallarchaeota archaeon]|nr:hypothetical protein [Candidatus Heimdallarchaeota archaeon]
VMIYFVITKGYIGILYSIIIISIPFTSYWIKSLLQYYNRNENSKISFNNCFKPDSVSSWMFLLMLFSFIFSKIDSYLIIYFLDIDQIGNYFFAILISSSILFLPLGTQNVLNQRFSKTNLSFNEVHNKLELTILINNMISSLFILFSYFIFPQIVLYIYGNKYQGAITIALHLMIIQTLRSNVRGISSYNFGTNELKKGFVGVHLPIVILQILLSFYLLKYFKINGLIFALYICSILLILSWLNIYRNFLFLIKTIFISSLPIIPIVLLIMFQNNIFVLIYIAIFVFNIIFNTERIKFLFI